MNCVFAATSVSILVAALPLMFQGRLMHSFICYQVHIFVVIYIVVSQFVLPMQVW